MTVKSFCFLNKLCEKFKYISDHRDLSKKLFLKLNNQLSIFWKVDIQWDAPDGRPLDLYRIGCAVCSSGYCLETFVKQIVDMNLLDLVHIGDDETNCPVILRPIKDKDILDVCVQCLNITSFQTRFHIIGNSPYLASIDFSIRVEDDDVIFHDIDIHCTPHFKCLYSLKNIKDRNIRMLNNHIESILKKMD